MTGARRAIAVGLVGIVSAAALAGCRVGSDEAEPEQSGGLTGRIEGLTVAAAEPDGYERDSFGDYDRDDALRRDREKYPDCDGYYSAADDRCHASADDVQIDHTVPLAEAWASGAHAWPERRLDEFAADPDNLSPMTSGLNMSKSDSDPADWLPPHKPAQCDYARTYVQTKTKYDLAVDRDERRALLRVARGCASSQS